MRVLFPVLSLFWFLHLPCRALAQQACDDSSLMSVKGSWKKTSDANTFPDTSFPKSQFPQVNKRIDKMQQIVHAAYPEPLGIEANWYRSISGHELVKNAGVPFQFTSMFLCYYCNKNENLLELGGETGTWLYVWANQLNWFAERVSYYTINKQPTYLLTPRAGELNGTALYRGIHNSNSNTGIAYSLASILTRDGQSPYVPVTRKIFLRAMLKWNEFEFNKNYANLEQYIIVRSNEDEEAYKRKQWDAIEKRTKPERLAAARENFLKNYRSSQEQKDQTLAKVKKDYEAKIKAAQDYLANRSEAELNMPAIIDNLTSFKDFSTAERGGQEFVRLNPDYFDPKLPKYIPQFLIVYWRWDNNAAGKYFSKQIEDHLDFKTLKGLIDK
ncbi:MAG: hypothetical protein ACJ75B_00050 [Flavisolibacter sp.]